MPDPTPYNISFSFAGYQATNPDLPLPAPRVDTELQNIETALDATQAALIDLRRNDGKLQNGIVTAEALEPGLALGMLPPTQWAVGVHYYPPAAVWNGNRLYQCLLEHVSGPDFAADLNAGVWNLVVDFQPPIDAANAAAHAAQYAQQQAENAQAGAENWASISQDASNQALAAAQAADDAKVAAQAAAAATAGSVSNAQASASAAAASASNAAARASEAATSASAAQTQATNAANSASTAGSSASAAATSATNAATSATNALNRANAAATSAANAAVAETNCGTSASNASTSAGNAAGSAINAQNQANFATNSANAAAASATQAQNSLGAMPGNFAAYTFQYSHFFGAPSSGQIRLDNAAPASATRMYIHDTSADSTPFRPFGIANVAPGMRLYFVNETDATRYVIYQVSAAPVLQTGYIEVPITHVGNSGNALIVDTRATLTVIAGGTGADVDFYERAYNMPALAAEPPLGGEIRMNYGQASALVTKLWIWSATSDGVNIGPTLIANTIRVGDLITLRQVGTLNNYAVFNVTTAPLLKAGGSYYEIAVSYVTTLGAAFVPPLALEVSWR